MKLPSNALRFIYMVVTLSVVEGKIKNRKEHGNSREKIKENVMVDKNKLATIVDEPIELIKTIEEINIAHGRFSDTKFPAGNRRSQSKFVTLWKDKNGRPRIPYVINIGPDNTTTNYTTIIKQSVRAMNEYMFPCGHEVWVEKEVCDKSGYIEFITTLNDGCWSYVGKQTTEKQQIGIGYGCNTKGTILHEMLHAMGVLHEHQRCDRDSYVEIVKSNIDQILKGEKEEIKEEKQDEEDEEEEEEEEEEEKQDEEEVDDDCDDTDDYDTEGGEGGGAGGRDEEDEDGGGDDGIDNDDDDDDACDENDDCPDNSDEKVDDAAIDENNEDDDALSQFECYYSIQQTHYSSSYDVFSIMHYDLWALSKKKKRTANTKTIRLKPEFMKLTKDIEELIGKMGRMSDTDKQEINTLYGCIEPTCIVSCNGTNTCAELPPTPNDKMRAQARIIKSLTFVVGGKMVAHIKKLEKEFRVFFKIHPNVYSKKLHNVVHLAVGSSIKNRGREVLGVWFSDAGDGRLNITIPTTKKFFITDPQPTNAYCTIDILQQKENSKYVYTIKINAETVYSEQNPMPKTFKNVQVYASNPWDLVQDTYIEGMFIINGKKDLPSMIDIIINPTDKVVQLSRKELCENEVIATMNVLKKEYSISFKLKPYSYSKEWASVLHISKGQNYGECGDRNPAVFFHKDGSGRLVFFSAINGDINSEFEANSPLPLNVWSSIEIAQTKKNGTYIYAISVNGSVQYEIENKDTKQFKDVKVYISDPWYTAHDGDIKELFIRNGDSKIADATQPRDTFKAASKQRLRQNNLVATMSVLNSTFTISFQMKPTSYSIGKHSVFHFMQDEFLNQQANKKIAAWFHEDGSGRLVIAAGFLDNENNITKVTTKDSLPLNKWSSIKLTRTEASFKDKSRYKIYINQKRILNVEKDAEPFEFVRVYFGDPWNSVQKGYIKNLKIYNSKF